MMTGLKHRAIPRGKPVNHIPESEDDKLQDQISRTGLVLKSIISDSVDAFQGMF